MVSLLKAFGKGILYILGLPFFLLVLILFAVIGLLIFIFQIFKSIIFFFAGHKFFPELPEDKELRLLLEGANGTPNSNEEVPSEPNVFEDISEQPYKEVHKEEVFEQKPISQPVFNNIEEACFTPNDNINNQEAISSSPSFEQSEETEDDLADILANSTPQIDQDDLEEDDSFILSRDEEEIVETKMEEEKKEEYKEEILETYTPKSSNEFEEADDEETFNGVDINFDDL